MASRDLAQGPPGACGPAAGFEQFACKRDSKPGSMSCTGNPFSGPRGTSNHAFRNLVHGKVSGILDLPYGSLSGNVTMSQPGGLCDIFIGY